jgi:fructokinase
MTHFIGIEGGGTKFVCVHGSNPNDLQDRTTIKTQSPDATMQEVIEYIRAIQKKTTIKAIGLAIFGPLDLDLDSATYGYVTTAAKPGWAQYDVVGTLKKAFDLPIGFDTDVNGSAIGEYRWGSARGLSDFLYLTIGTGIGGGAMVNGKLLHGASHPEMGHMLVPHHPKDTFEGICLYHPNCLESLASGPSMKARWKVNSALDLPEDHEAWDLEAHYLGLGLVNYILALSPKRIIMGGGVMRQTHLLAKIRMEIIQCLNGYLKDDKIIKNLDTYIVHPGLGEDSGICGAIALAEKSLKEATLLKETV